MSIIILSRRLICKGFRLSRVNDPLRKRGFFYLFLVLSLIASVNYYYLYWELMEIPITLLAYPLFTYPTMHGIALFIIATTWNKVRYSNGSSDLFYSICGLVWRLVESVSWVLIPWMCLEPHLEYDGNVVRSIGMVSLFTILNYGLFFELAIRGEELNYQSNYVGYWRPIPASEVNLKDRKIVDWSAEKQPYPKGVIVKYDNSHYIAMGETNRYYPDSYLCRLMPHIFGRHAQLRLYLLLIQCSITFVSSLLVIFVWEKIVFLALSLVALYPTYLMYRYNHLLTKRAL
eukprot:TRINITY_DN6218_c0_g4_i2.p1 TRINITY_DN6218_c0_g4~~TRINITY_DN6218_c0_g4_i2.p1  ORF type:complete len:288 (-),score=20.06 TRINITY_DN6218_c0_g4_i2:28-891(-)